LCGYDTWFLTLREEHRLSVFENRVLGKTFGFVRVEVIGEWKRVHNAELYDLYSTDVVKSRKMRYVVNVVRFGEGRDTYMVLAGAPEVRRPLGRPRRK